jgi:hypothetical protein
MSTAPRQLRHYAFIFSPSATPLLLCTASSLKQARGYFRARFPHYFRRAAGEIYYRSAPAVFGPSATVTIERPSWAQVEQYTQESQ